MATTTGLQSRIVKHGNAAPAALLANPKNWRTHSPEQRAALEDVLAQVGWVQDVIVNQRTGLLVDGHLRVEVARDRGEARIPVVYVDLSPDEEALILATFDPLTGMAGMAPDLLADLLAALPPQDGALAGLLASLAASAPAEAVSGHTEPDDVPALRPTKVKRGQVYRLGAHRLMCGDSTSAEDVARLLDGARPALMVTDPPYGVSYDPSWREEAWAGLNDSHRRLGVVHNDDRADWREAWALSPSSVAYVWHAAVHVREVIESLIAERFEIRSQIVWVKDRFSISRGHYHWRHEPCLYVVRKGSTANWLGGRSQTTVWEIASRDDAGHGHGTQKPVEAMERPIRNHKGDVYEPFAGSGTTLIAAERASRACWAMELDPQYVQVCIDRWEAYTGNKAERV
ncbi:MAG: DNA methyltransferase [Dehalococcoidia bacterium]